MRRLLINGVLTALIIVCLATIVLWIRSYVRVDVARDVAMLPNTGSSTEIRE